jgi:hypothetical protein
MGQIYHREYHIIIVYTIYRNNIYLFCRRKKCRNRSINHVNALIPAAVTEIAVPARSTTAKMAQKQTAGKMVIQRRRTAGRLEPGNFSHEPH